MFLLEKPYVSDFLKETIINGSIPVLDNATARECRIPARLLLTSEEAVTAIAKGDIQKVYCNSENAMDWLMSHIPDSVMAQRAAAFKNKFRFREMLTGMYPEYRFMSVRLEELEQLEGDFFPTPFIIKPATGFFSLGVHRVNDPEQWPAIRKAIQEEVSSIEKEYPHSVLNVNEFIIEQAIDGEEYALDVYYNEKGEAVIVNILNHLFASENDVNDRAYLVSSNIMHKRLAELQAYMESLGQVAGLANFCLHIELRITDDGQILPIEVNPMRFAGWCCTDIAHHAWGINPYLYFLNGETPDWPRLMQANPEDTWMLVVAEIAATVDRQRIDHIDLDAFSRAFSDPREIRPVDFRQYSALAFVFARMATGDTADIDRILNCDLNQFIHFS